MRILPFILAFLLFFGTTIQVEAKKKKSYVQTYTDTIVSKLKEQASIYNALKPDYDAKIFVNGNVDFLKRNRLQEFLPYLNKATKGVDHYHADFIGGITFTNPNIYNQTLFSISSNKKRFVERHIETIIAPNIRLEVYSQYLYGNLYSPLAYKSERYYNFSLDSIWHHNGAMYYKIGFEPKINNYKFVKGYLVTTNRNWSIREIDFSGHMELMDYTNCVEMGEEGSESEFLPKRLQIQTNARILGNHLYGNYKSTIKYNKIEKSHFVRKRGREKYNLTLQYNTNVDTLSALADYYVKYRDSLEMVDMSIPIPPKDTATKIVRKPSALEQMGRFVVNNHTFNLKHLGELKMNPLISPILFDFSSRHGLSYTQKLKFRKTTPKEQQYYFEPRFGYNFKYKEFYWGLKSEINYSPRRMSRLYFDIGNGNKIHTNRVRDALFSLPFMVFDSSKLNLQNFRNSYARVGHKIELFNGFTLGTNIAMQSYNETPNSDLTVIYPQSLQVKRSEEIAKHIYRAFVPEIEISYTPHQYYYYNGERKVYLYSRYPTFTFYFSKAIEGIFNSTTRFNCLEFDMNHQVKIGPMHNLYYRIGSGIFFDYSDLFFTEFKYMRRNNLPAGWDDDIGGAFQLLKRQKYNEIDKYFRVNARYDAPLLLVPSVFKNVKYITREKLYCNLLFANSLKPYMEIGYGIGTYLFNVGIFWGGELNKMNAFGAKFTLEIFNN